MENFKNENYVFSHDLDGRYDYIEHLIFDRNGKYLVGYGDSKICVLDLNNNQEKIKKEFEIQHDYFSKIYHLRYESLPEN